MTRGSELERADVLLVCSSGGHLLQLLSLDSAWREFTHLWITEDTSDARSLLREERVVFAYGPMYRNFALGTHRIVLACLRNAALAVRISWKVRPRVVLTTGAGTAVPFAWIARLAGARVVFVESVTRIDGPSVSCRLIAPIASRLYVQWPEMVEHVAGARYAGTVLPGR